MKTSGKKLLIIIALTFVACLVCIVWLASRPEEPDELNELVGKSVSDTSRGPSFEVRVVVPRMGRPFGGILPDWVVKKLDGTPGELRFDSASPGAQIVSVGPNHIELKADDWDLLIETDGEGRIAPGTHLVFPLALGGRHVKLNCRPADRATGFLTTTRDGSNKFAGRFLIELATCANADSGKAIEWPPAPLTVRGSFVGPVTKASPDPK